jgi:transcription-repair coupling factor (superfamily II helicase)
MKKTPTATAIGRLLAAPPLSALAEQLAAARAVSVSGLWGSSVAATLAAVGRKLNRPVLLVCGHIDESDDLADDIELFVGKRPEVLPALELAASLGRMSEEQVSNRLQLVAKFAAGGQGDFLVSPIHALMQSVPAKSALQHVIRVIKTGQDLEPEKLIVWLSDHGYNRLEQVEVPGDFAVRGGIIDVYLPGEHAESGDQVGLAVRIDFFGDSVESIKTFDLDSLGSKSTLQSIQIVDLKGQIDSNETTNFLSYLKPETIVALWAPLEIAEQAKSYLDRLPEVVKGIYPLNAVLKNADPFTRMELSQFDQGTSTMPSFVAGKEVPHVRLPVQSLQKFETEAKKAIAELSELSRTHQVVVFCENDGETSRFTELMEGEQPGLRGRVELAVGYLHRGFVWGGNEDERRTLNVERRTSMEGKEEVEEDPSALSSLQSSTFDVRRSTFALDSDTRPLALLGHHEIFHRYEQRRRTNKVIASRPVDSFLDLKTGDYVVHVAHGIARFMGMHQITKDGKVEEYLTLRFAENASLHVPAARINLIQKYVGGFQGHPTLSRLGSGSWEKQKAKVGEAVMDMAAELLEVQAARDAEQGTAYPPDTEWQREFEAAFPYEPTQDQVTAAEDIKQDMQKRRPMDRLLCGDVGYGKTEMAMRAAFKAMEYGKQVAVLVPTTILAEQHYRSFKARMAEFPFIVDSISRTKSAKEQKETLKKLASGEVDLLIGTHRLISKDVKFTDLGLVVIDEEQRFGVTHKERLKQMRKIVDVLTMSATPIPRTLHMSMVGLRDISSLTTAPQDRRSVVTEVMPFDRNRVKLAILRELQREGQVYFVHNRVNNIIEMADEIQQLVPDARILIGHGQMADGEMEDAMMKFIRHEADILVCTTIIESGLDIPNANTIIINNADRFGLSELHQLRGRVGRWKHRAYCYLLLPPDRPVTPVAAKRLKAIEEYSHLGAGFKIAMRDLEIRGAGNILGAEQSGHIAAVGYEMYCQLLEEAVKGMKNLPRESKPESHVDIGISAYIPKQYIPGDRQRMDVYRRLTRCSSLEMLAGVEQDVQDAFGEPPRQAIILFALTELRLLASIFGIESIIKKEPDIVLTVRDGAKAQTALHGAPGSVRLIDEKTVYLRMPPTFLEAEPCLMVLKNLMRGAYDRQVNGLPAPPLKPAAPLPPVVAVDTVPAARGSDDANGEPKVRPTVRLRETKSPAPAKGQKPKESADYIKLVTLRDQGILTEQEFQAALGRLLSSAKR